MHNNFRYTALILAAGLLLAACGGSGGSPRTFNLTFEPPDGSSLVGGQVTDLTYARTINRDLVLSLGITLTGRVTNEAGQPLADVDVSFRASATAPALDSDRTDGNGTYSVALPEGTWLAVLESGSDLLGTLTVQGVVVAGPGPVTRDFVFGVPVAVSGTVFDSVGAGIADAEIDFESVDTGARIAVQCDGAGDYDTSLVPDTYEAVVTPQGAAAVDHLKQRFLVTITGAGVQDFTLLRGVRVSGLVLTNLGVPFLETTTIKVTLAEGSAFFAPDEVESDDADGSYSVGPVPPEAVTFELEAPGDSGFPVQRFARSIAGPLTQDENFTLALGFVLSGTILRDDGATPEPEVEIEPVPTNGGPAPDDDETDAAGSFEISLFPGTYEVRITPRPANLQLPEVRTITISGPTTLDVVLARGAMLTGTVTTDGVTPAPDIRVEIPGVRGASDRTDGAGQYSFLAPLGTHTLRLTARDGPFEDIALAPVPGVLVTAPGPVVHDITLALATSGSTIVRGTVYGPDGLVPVMGAEIMAHDDTTGDTVGRTVSDGRGVYLLVIP